MTLTLSIHDDETDPVGPLDHDPVRNLIHNLERGGFDPRSTGPGRWESRCPVHQGTRRNLAIKTADDGKALVFCHRIDDTGRSCSYEEVAASLGMQKKDLFVATPGGKAAKAGRPKPKPTGAEFDSPRAAAAWMAGKLRATVTGNWDYLDPDGTHYATVFRFDTAGGEKHYRPVSVHPDSGRWILKDPQRWWPYRFPEIRDAARIWIFEGERCVNLAVGIGLDATTTAHGSGSPHKTGLGVLAGREVVISPDHDEAGEGYARGLLGMLAKLDPPARVKVLRLPGLTEEGDDLQQWLEARDGREAEGLKAELEALADALPYVRPQVEPEPESDPDAGQEMTYADLGLTRGTDVEVEAIDWLWKHRLARRSMALLAGDGGIGKSQVMIAIAAAITRGGVWPDGSGNAPVGSVVILSAEDRPSDTIVPRLMALDADMGKVHFAKAREIVRRPGKEPTVHITDFQRIDHWNAVFDMVPDCVLFIVDPLPGYLGRGVNDHKNSDVRSVVEPFMAEVIEPRGICMFCNTHLSKTSDARNAMARVTGSVAYVNLARNVHIIVKDPEDPARRYFSQPKCNNAPDDLPSMAFRIETREVEGKGGEVIETAVPVFEAEGITIDIHEMVNRKAGRSSDGEGPGRRGPAPEKTTKFAAWLVDQLERGPVKVCQVIDDAQEAGFLVRPGDGAKLSRTSLYRAKDRIPTLYPGRTVEEYTMQEGSFGRPLKWWKLETASSEDQDDGAS